MSELQAWVDKLGAMQPDDIRILMHEEGIAGWQRSPFQCPVARFLYGICERTVVVGYSRITSGGELFETPAAELIAK